MDPLDRALINRLQDGFPVCERPYAAVAGELGISEDELIARLSWLLEGGVLSRFGPMYHAERMGGGLCLCAMAVPDDAFEAVAEAVNARPEVAHNYAREHALNMWFVLATETPEGIASAATEIERETGLEVHCLPKLEEYYVGLRLEA